MVLLGVEWVCCCSTCLYGALHCLHPQQPLSLNPLFRHFFPLRGGFGGGLALVRLLLPQGLHRPLQGRHCLQCL